MLTTIDLIVLTAKTAVVIDGTWGRDRLVALMESGWRHTAGGLTLTLVALLDAIVVPSTATLIGPLTDAAALRQHQQAEREH